MYSIKLFREFIIKRLKIAMGSNRDRDTDAEETMQNVEIVGLEPRIGHILKKNGCESRVTVMNELVEINLDTLQKNKTLLFQNAIICCEEQLAELNMHDTIQLEPNKRRTKDTAAADIIDLYLYVIGVREDFPCRSLKDVSLYRDITLVMEDKLEEEGGEEYEEVGTRKGDVDYVDADGREGDDVEQRDQTDMETHTGETEDEMEDGEDDNSSLGIEEDTETEADDNHGEHSHPACEKCKDELKKLWEYIYTV